MNEKPKREINKINWECRLTRRKSRLGEETNNNAISDVSKSKRDRWMEDQRDRGNETCRKQQMIPQGSLKVWRENWTAVTEWQSKWKRQSRLNNEVQ